MKITNLDIIHVRPRWSFLKVSTDEGLVGWGEAIVEGRSRTVEMAIRELEPHLIGEDPRRIQHLWQSNYRGTFYHGGPVLTSAVSAIDQALWDILGKWLNVPVSQLLGGAVRERIRMYGHVGGETLDDIHASAKKAVEAGFTAVKTSIANPARFLESPAWIQREIERFEVIRDAIGPENDFAVDFHGRIQPALAIKLCKELERLNPLFVEEPCLSEELDEMARIARATSIPIATGERLYTKYAFRELLSKQAATIVQPDLAHCGGISEALNIARLAEAHFAAFAPHNPLGPINLAASLQVSAVSANFLAQEHVHLGEGYIKTPFEVKDGYIDVPTAPGLGIEVDETLLEDKRYDGVWDSPRWFHEDDGSVADW
ncbi:galactonate dehydratase [Pullulanibacillus pueri]|uniref:Galactonate dehydratase n=1 Tax=Pullulanibacillus pueri TaxID=1437324 RepID=A0A8J2ZV91_9BACL|nr:galactonate dehydratase [Pullulanibacillus pueri]MBM7681387.1 galactonate dehydratase [Pullulanibacillus pueri]GGH78678.1 galactonate dehydratase [Pullulanibacillus pueri]